MSEKPFSFTLSFVDDGEGHFKDVAISGADDLDPEVLASFLWYLSDQLAAGKARQTIAS